MEQELFNDLLESIQEAGEIVRGECEAARVTEVDYPDVVAIREGLELTRDGFARLLNVSPHTVQAWEQGKRNPSGAARSLLIVATKHTKLVLES